MCQNVDTLLPGVNTLPQKMLIGMLPAWREVG